MLERTNVLSFNYSWSYGARCREKWQYFGEAEDDEVTVCIFADEGSRSLRRESYRAWAAHLFFVSRC